MQEEMWRNLVNGLPELPQDGSGAPDMEIIKDPNTLDGESPIYLQKIITEVYVYNSVDGENVRFGTQTFQTVHQLGHMRLSEALQLIDKRKKRGRK